MALDFCKTDLDFLGSQKSDRNVHKRNLAKGPQKKIMDVIFHVICCGQDMMDFLSPPFPIQPPGYQKSLAYFST